jgi:quercetin dioxygenase-like cupin family protein
MARRTSTRRLLVGAVIATTLLTACSDSADDTAATQTTAPAAASSAPALAVEELAEGDQGTELDVDVDGPVQVNYRKITIPPGGGTGEHCHYGQLIGVVESGTLTHYAPIYKSGVHEYRTGDSLVEGAGYVHEGKNEGTEDVVLWVTYVTPEGEPLAETDLAECDKR